MSEAGKNYAKGEESGREARRLAEAPESGCRSIMRDRARRYWRMADDVRESVLARSYARGWLLGYYA